MTIPNAPFGSAALLTRRRLLAAAGGAGLVASGGRTLAQDATPEASPVASPTATSTPTPTATPTPGPPTAIGGLTIVDDPQPQYTAPPQEGGELALMLTAGDNLNFNPAAFAQDYTIMVSYLDPLVWIDALTGEPQPWLAQSWEWSEDGAEITYRLRGDVVWHDGEPLHARDVAFSFLVYRDDVFSGARNLFVNMVEAIAEDERTVRVRLSAPDGGWLLNASSQLIFQRAQYRDYWERNTEGERTLSGYNWRERKPLGTGPWVVGERTENRIDLGRNEEYWAGKPYTRDMRIVWDTDPAARLSAWAGGDVDIIWPVTAAELQPVQDQQGTVYLSDSMTVMFAAFNFNYPQRQTPTYLSDLRLREALSLAIDRERIAREVFGGFFDHTVAGAITQPLFRDPEAVNPVRDIGRARELLDELEIIDRDEDGIRETPAGEQLGINVIVRNTDVTMQAVLESVRRDFEEINLNLEVRVLSPERFEQVWVNEQEFDLIALSYTLHPGFTDFDLYGSAWDIRVNAQGFNPGGYRNEAVDRAIDTAMTAVELGTLQEAVRTIHRETTTDLFALWFGAPKEAVLVAPDVYGYEPYPLWPTWNTRKLYRGD